MVVIDNHSKLICFKGETPKYYLPLIILFILSSVCTLASGLGFLYGQDPKSERYVFDKWMGGITVFGMGALIITQCLFLYFYGLPREINYRSSNFKRIKAKIRRNKKGENKRRSINRRR